MAGWKTAGTDVIGRSDLWRARMKLTLLLPISNSEREVIFSYIFNIFVYCNFF